MNHLTWIEIDRKALRNNLTAFKGLVGDRVEIMPVIKSNAYGHGLTETARCISEQADWLGVYSLAEALLLRADNIGNKIFVLSFFEKSQLTSLVNKDITLPLYSLESAIEISKIGLRYKTTLPVHIKIDVGTSRLGILPQNAHSFLSKVNKLKGLRVDGVFSHLADSENFNQEYTNSQIRLFNKTIKIIESRSVKIKYKHLACSAATIINPKSRNNLVRLGISFYGLWPSKDTKALYERHFRGLQLRPALTWKTTIQQIKTIPTQTYVGYGCSYKTKRKTTLAVIPIGYWDGYDRRLSNIGEVLVRGSRARVLGRVCMNMTMIDITDIPNIHLNDTVVIIGQQGSERVSADEVADKVGTINYEIVSRINPLIPRKII